MANGVLGPNRQADDAGVVVRLRSRQHRGIVEGCKVSVLIVRAGAVHSRAMPGRSGIRMLVPGAQSQHRTQDCGPFPM